MQSGRTAARCRGFYCEREFDFAAYEGIRPQLVELGRACILRQHRTFEVLNLLWKGLAAYARQSGARYLIGCSSMNSISADAGSAMYRRLRSYLTAPELRTRPQPEFAFPLNESFRLSTESLEQLTFLLCSISSGCRNAFVPGIWENSRAKECVLFEHCAGVRPSSGLQRWPTQTIGGCGRVQRSACEHGQNG
jgi:hypothetical protein